MPYVIAILVYFMTLGFFGAPPTLWWVGAVITEYFLDTSLWLMDVTIVLGLIFSITTLRALFISRPIMGLFKRIDLIPKISETEKQAIEAGSTWVEKEFFSGVPSLKSLLSQPKPLLSEEETTFLETKVETLCQMVDDWKLWQQRDLSPEVWEYIKRERFLGIIIPKQYGGLGFSPYAHSEAIKKISSHSFVVAIYVMVPNSLGPAELLNHYGTREQKDFYLPRLASGKEIPCFALTEVSAGSDAGNIQSTGVLFKKEGILQIRLNWEKRYTSLAKISTLMGMAFHLRDPEHLLGGEENIGITCALVPTHSKGVTINKRHDPLGVPFYNCPSQGKDVIIRADAIVGGVENAGKGWKMLMECLAAGRGISFPAQMAGSSQLVCRYVVPYAQIREQFGISLTKFDGIQKPLADVISFTYLVEALRMYTLSALCQGIKPAVIASMAKYYSTEHSRKLLNHAMDILGGAGISLGPKNKIAPYYIGAPISITVEGANILTRCLMIFGQGAFRAHPFAFSMIDGLAKNDSTLFDQSFFGFVGHGIQSFSRSVLLSMTRGWLAFPFSFKKQSRYYRRISWASATFAFYTDVAMGSLGGKLKTKEHLTGRFADVMSYLYLASAVLRKYESDGEKAQDWPVVHYTLEYIFGEIEIAFQGIYANFPVPLLGALLKGPVRLWSRLNPLANPVTDEETASLMGMIHSNPAVLSRLTSGTFVSHDPNDSLNLIERAAQMKREIEPLLRTIKHAKSSVQLTAEDQLLLDHFQAIKKRVLRVDEFLESEYHHHQKVEKAPIHHQASA